MKEKIIMLVICFLSMTSSVFAQLQILNDGDACVGTLACSEYTLREQFSVIGDIYVLGYDDFDEDGDKAYLYLGKPHHIRGEYGKGVIIGTHSDVYPGNIDALTVEEVTGNVGVGTLDPSARLDVDGGDILVQGSDSFQAVGDEATLFLGDTNNYIRVKHTWGVNIRAYNAPDALWIRNGGNVGIGLINPPRKFWVEGDSGGRTQWYNDSDRELKDGIQTIDNALQKVEKLRGVYFKWKDMETRPQGRHMGMIAQEVMEVVPEIVEKKGKYYSMASASMVALLVEAIKEQQKTIEQQQEIITVQRRVNDNQQNIIADLVTRMGGLEETMKLMNNVAMSVQEQ